MRGEPARRLGANLAPGEFLSLVGVFDHTSQLALHHPYQDRHHLYVWLELPPTAELYECAVNTRLSPQSRMQVACLRQECPPASWPPFGRHEAALSYPGDLGLREGDFREEQRAPLVDELRGLLPQCSRLQVFGFAYGTGNGLHDIHMNSGEPRGTLRPDRPGQDGALVLYFEERPGVPAHALWLCLKFAGQSLP